MRNLINMGIRNGWVDLLMNFDPIGVPNHIINGANFGFDLFGVLPG
jgi:hypothetical protein